MFADDAAGVAGRASASRRGPAGSRGIPGPLQAVGRSSRTAPICASTSNGLATSAWHRSQRPEPTWSCTGPGWKHEASPHRPSTGGSRPSAATTASPTSTVASARTRPNTCGARGSIPRPNAAWTVVNHDCFCGKHGVGIRNMPARDDIRVVDDHVLCPGCVAGGVDDLTRGDLVPTWKQLTSQWPNSGLAKRALRRCVFQDRPSCELCTKDGVGRAEERQKRRDGLAVFGTATDRRGSGVGHPPW